MPPEVSVILPFYNAEATLKKAIQSILDQTFSDFEMILVDNNSTDQSRMIAEKSASWDKRVRIFHEEKQGVTFAMDKGLEKARGKYMARMDADDISLPQRLEKQVNYLNKCKEIGLVGAYVNYVSSLKRSDGFERFVDWVNSFHTPESIFLKRFIEIPVINPTIMFRREMYEKHGGCLDGNFPEDYEMQLRFLQAGVQMNKIPEKLLDWHDSPKRLTRTDGRYSDDAFFRVKARYFNLWSEKNNPFHPEIWVWGAGRKTRQRAAYLEKEGLIIKGFFDLEDDKTSVKPCLGYLKIPVPGKLFIVSMVAKYNAREQIGKFLFDKGYIEGKDFMMMA